MLTRPVLPLVDDHDDPARRRLTLAVSTGKTVTPEERDLMWFELLRDHGPLPGSFLAAFSEGRGMSGQDAKQRLADLSNEQNTPDGGPYLVRPRAQFIKPHCPDNLIFYELSPAGQRVLDRHRPTTASWRGANVPWMNGAVAACITASIELATLSRHDIDYIPAAVIAARAMHGSSSPFRIDDPRIEKDEQIDLMADAIFGLVYKTETGERSRYFLVNVDKPSDPLARSFWNRNSFEQRIRRYVDLCEHCLWRDRGLLQAMVPLTVLTLTSAPARTAQLIDFMTRMRLEDVSYLLFQTWFYYGPPSLPQQPNYGLLADDWLRSGLPAVSIDRS